jgi:putative aldouronate transport system substrate-binding protein
MMKKLLVMALSLMTLVSVFGGGSKASDTSQAQTQGGGRKYTALPYSDGSKTLSIFTGGIGPLVTTFDYPENKLTKTVVDETGIRLSFTAVSTADRNEKMSVLLNSGDYPDIIFGGNLSVGDISYYAGQGVLTPLDNYHTLEYPNIGKTFAEYPALNQKLRGSDGKLYALPIINDQLHVNHRYGRATYYMPFIRDNGLKVPATLAEFETYLRWIRDNDANKNGNKNDEIPAAFCRDDIKQAVAFAAKAYMPFVFTDNYFGLALDNSKKVTEQYRAGEFREALKFLAGLYKEKLILEDSFTMTRAQLRTLGENPNVPILAVGLTQSQNNLAVSMSERWIDYFMLSPLRGPTGQRWNTNRDPWGIIQAHVLITNKCKDPELAVALIDHLMSWEMNNNNSGPKGQAWDKADPGTVSLMGTPAIFKKIVNWGTQPINVSWDQELPRVNNPAYQYGSEAADLVEETRRWVATGDPALKPLMLTSVTYNNSMNYFTYVNQTDEIPDNYFIPPIAIDDADNARIADINASLDPYKEQACVEFISGVRDITSDTAWNAYLANLDRLGSKELAQIIQKYIK